jgi:uncharacterized protein involved in outer membrane biogenesis
MNEPASRPARPNTRSGVGILWLLAVAAAALIGVVTLFDWNSLRQTAERFAGRVTGCVVSIGHLSVRVSLTPTIIVDDLVISSERDAESKPLARASRVEFGLHLPSLLSNEIVLPHLSLTNADINLIRTADGTSNWAPPHKAGQRRRSVTVRALSVDNATIAYHDAQLEMSAYLRGKRRDDGVYRTRFGVSGQWRKSEFTGIADTGGTISLRDSAESFPIRLALKVGRTSVKAEGHVADVTRFQHIDAMFDIGGPSLASLYPTLRLALPETPPYRVSGKLERDGDHFRYQNFFGTIGNTDIHGDAEYEAREPRPFLTATLNSRRLDLADLGPAVGLRASGADAVGDPAPGRSVGPVVQPPSERVVPASNFNLPKLNAMDADVRLTAASLSIPEQIPLENVASRIGLRAGVLTLDPLNFGFAGGELQSAIVLDARSDPITASMVVNMKRVRLSELFPTVERMKQSGGRLGAQLRLKGRGNSVAELLGSANGSITAGMAGGRISELAVWMVNLQGGELLRLLVGGDRQTRIRCAAFAMNVVDGVGTVDSFIFDTEESRIDGAGLVNFRQERFRAVLRPEPKKPGLLSLRGPVAIEGTFRHIDYRIAPESVARGLSAVALGLVNPFLALLPLIETGPGEDANCREVLAPVRGAIRQAGSSNAESSPRPKRQRNHAASAPKVDVPANSGQRAAPMVDNAPPRQAP